MSLLTDTYRLDHPATTLLTKNPVRPAYVCVSVCLSVCVWSWRPLLGLQAPDRLLSLSVLRVDTESDDVRWDKGGKIGGSDPLKVFFPAERVSERQRQREEDFNPRRQMPWLMVV